MPANRTSRVLCVLLVGGAVLSWAAAAGSPAKRLTLVYNVNNGGYVDVCGCEHKQVKQGSLTRRASFLKQLRGTGRALLLLDGGSALFPIEERVKDEELDRRMRQAELIVEAYNRMGYHAMAVGPFDLAAGLENLKVLEKKARFALLSANLVDAATSKPVFRPHATFDVGGARVGVIGLTQASMGSYFFEKVARGARVLDPVQAARESLEALRGQADLVVALAHLSEEEARALATALPEIEVLVDPCIQMRSHRTWIREEDWVTYLGATLRLRSDGQGARIGVVDVEISERRAKLLSADRLAEIEELARKGPLPADLAAERAAFRGKNLFRFWRISLEPHHGRDAETDRLVAAWKAGADLAAVPRETDPLASKDEYLTVDVCKTCHEKQYENWRRTKHASAMESLVAGGNEADFDCIGCHSLGYGRAFLNPADVGPFANVQCESCHGTNPEHPKDPKKNRFRPVFEAGCIDCHNKEVLGPEKEFLPSREMPKVRCPKSA